MTVRELRLGMIGGSGLRDKIKASICNKGQLLGDCENSLSLDMFQINTVSWVFPTGPITCRDRGNPPPAVVEPTLGVSNEVMLIRACIATNPMFPSAIMAANMTRSSVGDYFITAVSAYVNEP
jgi:hypothetical protein